MSEMITIQNGTLAVTISTYGAEMHSIRSGDKEYLWGGDPAVWASHAPIMFPICGGLKEDKFEYAGREFSLTKHGFAKFSEFTVESNEGDRAVFLLTSNEESLAKYPFDFELRVGYTLLGNTVKVDYTVKNLTDGEMYFSAGGHEAYLCLEGIEEYELVFEKPERLTHNPLHGNLLATEPVILGENVTHFPLRYSDFDIDALTFLNLASRSVTLKGKDRQVRIDFEGFDYMFVWTKPKMRAGYICVEPWAGIPDFEGSSYDFTEKTGIQKLARGEEKTLCHTITIEK